MEVLSAITERRARRALSPEPIAAEVRDRLLQAATMAPSCMNKQPWRFIAVEGEETLAKLKGSLTEFNYWGKPAPLIFAVATKVEWDCRNDNERDYAYFGTGMAAMNLMTQATAEGLYAHPIAGFNPVLAKEALGIPEDVVLLTLIICGRPGDASALNEKHQQSEVSERRRKDMDRVTAVDRWNEGLRPD